MALGENHEEEYRVGEPIIRPTISLLIIMNGLETHLWQSVYRYYSPRIFHHE